MGRTSTTSEFRANLRRIYIDAIAFSVMVGVGETYLAAFVLALGHGELAAGLVASIPLLAGAVIQLISPAAVRNMGSHRRWVVFCAIAQASSFIPLVIAATMGRMNVFAVFAVAALYWGTGMATGPAWNTWVGTLVPRRIRANYFAQRSRAGHIAVLAGLVAAGLSLQFGKASRAELTTFAMLFALAALCRFVSATLLSRQDEPEPPNGEHRVVPVREWLGRFRSAHDGKLLMYMLALQTAVQISGPYFTPFMLKQLQMSYANYLLLIATSFSARILLLPMLGGLVRTIGAKRVLWYSGIGLVPLSALWLVSDSIAYLFFVQLIAGAVWAAYELATFLLLFETIREEERTSVLTTFNLANAIAMVVGSLIGGAILTINGASHAAYMAIFAASCLARIITLPLLSRAVSATPAPRPLQSIPVPTRVVAVRPNLGAIERPVLPGITAAEAEVVETNAAPHRSAGVKYAGTTEQVVVK
jgi:MFS family permease